MWKNRFSGLATLLVVWALAGCGGGSGGGSSVSISGVAATGAAIASGTVTLKCASGTSYTTTTGLDGKFSIDISNGSLPCLAQVAYTDGAGAAKKLRTIITAAGTANITPITELVLAKLTGTTAASAYDNFNAATVKGYTAADIATAVAAVKTYVAGLGVSVTSFPSDPIGAKFVPASGSTSGDAVDALLDAFKAKLAANGTTLDQAVATLNSSGGSGGGSGGGIPSLGSLTISNASLASRNGTYAPSGAAFNSSGTTGFNGITADGKLEMEVVWASNATILRAHIWFYDTPSTIKFFGCDGSVSLPCTGVVYEPLMKQVWFTNVAFKEVTPDLTGATPDVQVSSGETLTVNATLDAK